MSGFPIPSPTRYSFTVPGAPTAKARPRMTHAGHVFTPQRTARYEALVEWHARAAGVAPLEGPVAISADFFLPRPKRLCRKKDPAGALPHMARPDLDNLLKSVTDGLNGVAYADDAQVALVEGAKFYHAKDAGPEARIVVRALGGATTLSELLKTGGARLFRHPRCRSEGRRTER